MNVDIVDGVCVRLDLKWQSSLVESETLKPSILY